MGTIPTVAIPLDPHQKRFTFFVHPEFLDDFLDDFAHDLAVFNPRLLAHERSKEQRSVVDDEDEEDLQIDLFVDWDEVHADEIRSLVFDLLARHDGMAILKGHGEDSVG
jgi:hypothetical protein